MTFIEILKKDHEEVKQLFNQIEKEGGDKQKIFSKIHEELKLHMEVEEKFLYPALEKHDQQVKEKAFESYEEHHVAKTVLNECAKVSPDNDRWKAKVSVLKELIDHHVQEEEKELFKMAKQVLDKNQIQEITEKIQQQKSKRG